MSPLLRIYIHIQGYGCRIKQRRADCIGWVIFGAGPVPLCCLLASEQRKNKVVSKCRAEKRRAAGLGDGTVGGGGQRSFKKGETESKMVPQHVESAVFSFCVCVCFTCRPQTDYSIALPAPHHKLKMRPAVLCKHIIFGGYFNR